jgi:hypothetical protein
MMSLSNGPEAALFGVDENLVGVYTPAQGKDSAKSSSADGKFAVVMVTAGMLHSPGPFGLHADLAVSLAQRGIASLRFDLYGIGESLAGSTSLASLDRAAAEISTAADWLREEHDLHSIGLFGLCSGADDAIYAATQSDDFRAIFAVDGCGYKTRGYYWIRMAGYYLPKIFNAQRWRSFLSTKFASEARNGVPSSLQLQDDIREFPERKVAEQQLQALGERGIRVNMFYTGGVGEYFNHAGQFKRMFPSLNTPNVTSEYWPECDHTAFLLEHRQQLVDRATSFFASCQAK